MGQEKNNTVIDKINISTDADKLRLEIYCT